MYTHLVDAGSQGTTKGHVHLRLAASGAQGNATGGSLAVRPKARLALFGMHRASRSLVDLGVDLRCAEVARGVREGETRAEEKRGESHVGPGWA